MPSCESNLMPDPVSKSATRPTVTIVLITMNALKFVADALNFIQAQTYPTASITTVVVDHASIDRTPVLIAERFPWVRLITERTNHGFAGGNNIGMKRYPADYYALVNPDARLDPNWLTVLIDVLEADPTIGVAGSKIFYGDGKLLQHTGGMFRANALTYHLGDKEAETGNTMPNATWIT